MKLRVLVVGGGIAGVSLGCELAEAHDVTVLEAEATLGAHATGRSAALFLERYGPATVRALTKASRQLFRDLEAPPDAPPLLTPRGCVWTAWDDRGYEMLAALLADDRGLTEVDRDEAGRLCSALRTSELRLAALDDDAEDIDVMALHGHYVRLMRRRGGRTVSGAAVARVARTGEGWTVTARDGRSWFGDVLVNAAGAWGDVVHAMCGVAPVGLVPHRRTVAIAPTESAVDVAWPVVGDVTEAWYFKPEGTRVLLSPADETPAEAGDAKPEDLDVALALELVNARTTLQLRTVQTTWAGLRTFVADRVPVVGFHPDDPALFCYVGQGGYGIQMAPALALAAADIFNGAAAESSQLSAALSPTRQLAAVPSL